MEVALMEISQKSYIMQNRKQNRKQNPKQSWMQNVMQNLKQRSTCSVRSTGPVRSTCSVRSSSSPRKLLIMLSIVVYAAVFFFGPLASLSPAQAQYLPEPGTPNPEGVGLPKYFEPPRCTSGQGHISPDKRVGSYCPDITTSDPNARNTANYPYPCADSYDEWLKNPNLNFWVEDPEVTALGKGGERSRQFLLWSLTRQSIDDHPVILDVWKLSQNVALFMILLVVIIMGIGIIIGKRSIGVMGSSFNLNIEITPIIIKVALLLLFIVFSARIVLTIIQIADVMMEFFIRTLGVRELFNIFFTDTSGNVGSLSSQLENSEKAYREFVGCTNWNIGNQEMVNMSKGLVRFTNLTYYFIGGMMILRKVVLWFLTMVAPFLAILAPFVFIRNIGWIWVGVFFQWVFYGPLMALFLGGLANIWNSSPVHIPYIFDFSRVHSPWEAVYPTSINILYGGPAQELGLFNTANYVDTFAEYIISLIMLWTVLVLPWWLLRIFRDYCCDGIYAMKNILLSMYDQMRTGPGPGSPPGEGPTPKPVGTGNIQLDLPKPSRTQTQVDTTVNLQTQQQIREARTEQIVQSMQMEASSLKDVARMETDRVTRETVTNNLNKVQNPFKAETPSERQRLMNLRNEVQARAKKGDATASRLASVTSQSETQQKLEKDKLISTMPQVSVPEEVAVITSEKVKETLPQVKQQTIYQSSLAQVTRNNDFISEVAQSTNTPAQQATNIMQTFARISALDTSTEDPVAETAQEVGVNEERVKRIVARTAVLMRQRSDLVEQVARKENVDKQTVVQTVQEKLRDHVGITDDKTQNIVARVLSQVAYDQDAVQTIAQQSQVSVDQAKQVLAHLGTSGDPDMSPKETVDQTAEKSGVEREQVKAVLQQTASVVGADKEIVKTVSETEAVDEETVEDVAKTKIEQLSKADKDIEDYVPETQKVSIEDYEEVKSMWLEHYENGEIPVTENVTSRQEWVEQDVVRISNILNKLMSSNKELKNQGLTEVGYILPIFMVNNLSGEELLVYLKAKIQAAKQISRELKKVEKAKEQAESEKEENLVSVEAPQKEAEKKKKVLKRELPIDEDEESESGGSEGGSGGGPTGGSPGGPGQSSGPGGDGSGEVGSGVDPDQSGRSGSGVSNTRQSMEADAPADSSHQENLKKRLENVMESTGEADRKSTGSKSTIGSDDQDRQLNEIKNKLEGGM